MKAKNCQPDTTKEATAARQGREPGPHEERRTNTEKTNKAQKRQTAATETSQALDEKEDRKRRGADGKFLRSPKEVKDLRKFGHQSW